MEGIYIAAYGIVNRLTTIVFMLLIGLAQGVQSILGYNFGAKYYHRVKRTLKLTIICGICIAGSAFMILQCFPGLISRLFTTDAELIDLSSQGLRIMSAMLPLVGFQVVSSNFFLSIGYAKKSIFLSLTRQFIILIPCVMIMPVFWGVTGVWASSPAADLIAAVVTGVMLVYQLRLFKSVK